MKENEKMKNKIIISETVEEFLIRFIQHLEKTFTLLNVKYYACENLKFIIQENTNMLYMKWDEHLWNFLVKEYKDNYLGFLNWMLGIFSQIKISDGNNKDLLITEYIKKYDVEDDCERINNFLKIFLNNLKYHSLTFNEEKYQIIETTHYELLNNINNEGLNNLVYKIKSSNDLLDKSSFMSTLAKNMLYYLSKNSEYFKCLSKYFKLDFLKNLQRECNAYFRHTSNDCGDKEKAKEWEQLNENQKNKKINETLTYYLSIIAILKDKIENFNFEIKN